MRDEFLQFMTGPSMRGFDFFVCFVLFAGCVTYGIRRLMLNPLSKLPLILFLAVASGGGVWSAVPYFTYELPPRSSAGSLIINGGSLIDSYPQRVRDKYPHHLMDPGWFIHERRWPLAETCARFALVTVVLAIIFYVSQRWARCARNR